MYARARAKADELLKRSEATTWRERDSLTGYMESVSKPAIKAARLSKATMTRYELAMKQLKGECGCKPMHASLKGHSIATGTRFRTLEQALQGIAQHHGSESARQARGVLSKYVLQQLIRDELLQANPLAGMSIDLRSDKPTGRKRVDALTLDEYERTMDYLLDLDPADGVEEPKRGRWTLADRIANRRNAIDLTLLLMTTGLRVGEANALTWADVTMTDDGHMLITATDEKRQRHLGAEHSERLVQVVDNRVAAHLERRRGADAEHVIEASSNYVIGAPADPAVPWDGSNCRKHIVTLYKQLAEDLKITEFEHGRTHMWRKTLNSITYTVVPEAVRLLHFGHSQDVSRQHYLDANLHPEAVAEAIEALRSRTKGESKGESLK